MIQITLPDGSVKEVAKDSSPFDVARTISEGLARAIISAKFNETVVETSTPLTTDGTLVLYTFDNPEGKKGFLAFLSTCIGSSGSRIVSRCQIDHRSCD